MKKTIAISLICCLLLVGCTFTKRTYLRVKAGTLKAPIGSYVPIEGTDVEAIIIREVSVTPFGKQEREFSDITYTTDESNNGSLTITKPTEELKKETFEITN